MNYKSWTWIVHDGQWTWMNLTILRNKHSQKKDTTSINYGTNKSK